MDSKYYFLTYYLDKYNDNNEPILFISYYKKIKRIDLSELSMIKDKIVSYDFYMLVPHFRRKKIELPPKIIDITDLIKVKYNYSKKDKKFLTIWDVVRQYNFNLTLKEIFRYCKIIENPTLAKETVIIDFLKRLLLEIELIFYIFIESLLDKIEVERFFTIENKLTNLLLTRQYLGININQSILLNHLRDIDKELYLIQDKLEKDFGFDFEINKNNSKLQKKIVNIRNSVNKNTKSIGDIIKEKDEESILLSNFFKLIKNKKSLLRICSIGEEKVYPLYNNLSTRTARIGVSYPFLQNIKQKYRNIITPNKGNILLYSDFSQFEPGILASLSNCHFLINMYNKGDIYKELSMVIFEKEDKRDFAKQIFLSYLYGLNIDEIVSLICDYDNTINYRKTLLKLKTFFYNFREINDYKEKIFEEFSSNNYIDSVFGNYRKRVKKNINRYKLTNSEKRWVFNHKIQSTASLILKKSIIEVMSQNKDILFLLPMHDAVLWEINKTRYNEVKNKIDKIFKSNFKKYCPNINPRVNFDSFYKKTIMD